MAWSRKLKLTLLVGGSLLGIAACLAIAHFRRGGNVHPNDSGYFAIQSWRDYRDLRGLLWLQKNGAKKGTPADQAKAVLGLPNEVRRRSIDREDWVYVAVDMRTKAQTHWAVRIEDRRVAKWFMTAPVLPPARTEKYVPSEFTGRVPAAKFFEGRSAIHRRVIGVLMTASISATSQTMKLTWALDYDGPRPPLTILKPSLENGSHGQTVVLVYAEGKYGGAFEQRLISPSAAGKYWSRKKWFATIKKGERASGEITISVPKARDYFRRHWPRHFDGTTPKLHVQLVHKPWDRGEQHGFDAWTGELHSKVLEVPPAPISAVKVKDGVSLRLTTNKSSFKFGEEIRLKCTASNVGEKPVHLQTRRPLSTLVLTVTVPGGAQFSYSPYRYKKLPPLSASCYSELAPGDEVGLFEFVGKAGNVLFDGRYWCAAASELAAGDSSTATRSGVVYPVPFQSGGTYEVRVTYGDAVPKKTGAFTGPLAATLEIRVEGRVAPSNRLAALFGRPAKGPDKADGEYAKTLDPSVLRSAIKFLREHKSYKGRFPCTATIVAARPVGEFILLDISFGAPTGEHYIDGNAHLVYSKKKQKIVRTFCWYEQG